jgi:single-stranded-DNA-specific exonuclease
MNAVSEWRLRPCSEETVLRLVRTLAISPWIARILAARGIESPEEARAFLEPESQPYHDPFDLPGMDAFVQRIDRAVKKKEKVVVHGDYDADGVTSTAILCFALQRVGLSPKVFLPERFEGGYGVQPEWVEKQREENVDLIVTIDCGSGAREAVAKANEVGIDLIVCDHHTPNPDLPPTVAHINPHLPDSKYPFKDLCAAGLALKLAQALIALVPPSFQADYRENLPFDLAMVGTIADVMPLLGENRRIVVDGLDRTKTNPSPGLRILLESAGCDPAGVNCETIAFQVAPRLNAAGRLESPRLAFDLLTGQDPDLLREAAAELEKINNQRKRLAAKCAEEAVAKLEKDPPRGAAVVADENWHRGILGIVAARVMETFGLPTFVASIEGDTAHGSARVPDGWNAVELLERAKEFTERAGGHAGAAGFAVPMDKWEGFCEAIRTAAQEAMDEPVAAILEVDAYLTEGRLHELFEEVSRLEPYGVGFPAPVYSVNRFESGSRHSLFGDNHLKIQLGVGPDRIEAVGFGMGEWGQDLGKRPMDLALEYGENHWNGRTFLRPRILAIRPALAEKAVPAGSEEVIRIDAGVGVGGPSIVVWDVADRIRPGLERVVARTDSRQGAGEVRAVVERFPGSAKGGLAGGDLCGLWRRGSWRLERRSGGNLMASSPQIGSGVVKEPDRFAGRGNPGPVLLFRREFEGLDRSDASGNESSQLGHPLPGLGRVPIARGPFRFGIVPGDCLVGVGGVRRSGTREVRGGPDRSGSQSAQGEFGGLRVSERLEEVARFFGDLGEASPFGAGGEAGGALDFGVRFYRYPV